MVVNADSRNCTVVRGLVSRARMYLLLPGMTTDYLPSQGRAFSRSRQGEP